MDKITDETVIGTTELATVLGLTVRRVQQLIQDGTIQTVSRGKISITDAVQRYINYISGDHVSEDDKKIEKARMTAEVTIKASKAKIAKLEADELEGKMHRSEDVLDITTDMIVAIRGMLSALPGRLAIDVKNARTVAEASTIIRNAVYGVMEEISHYQYDPEKYAERVRERQNWENQSGVENDEN